MIYCIFIFSKNCVPYEKKYYLKTQQYRNEGIRSFRYLQYTFNATSFVEQFSNKKFFFQ